LHEVVLRSPPLEQVDPEMAEWQAQLQRQMLPLTIALRVVTVPLRIFGWFVAPLFALWWRWKGAQQIRTNRLLGELLPQETKPRVEQQGTQLVNHLHRCRITIPAPTKVLPQVGSDCVFHFQLAETDVRCQAIRPAQIARQMKLWPGSEILEDEKTYVDTNQARIVRLKGQQGERDWQIAWYLVQTSQAIYRFQAAGVHLPADTLSQLRAVLDSFRVEDASRDDSA
jgi:hypothetical protein